MAICSLDLLAAKFILILLLFGVDLSASNLFLLELFDAILFTLVSQSLERVWPVLDPSLTQALKILPFVVTHAKVGILMSLLNRVLDAIELVKTNHDGATLAHRLAPSRRLDTGRSHRCAWGLR